MVVEAGQDQRPDEVVERPDRAADLDARPVRQPYIEDGHVRPEDGQHPRRLAGGPRLAHHFDVVGPENLANTAANDLMVVQQEHPDGCHPGHPTF